MPFTTSARIGFVDDTDAGFCALVIVDPTTGATLEIQRAQTVDAQDAAAGMDTYCLVHDGATHYGGITAWTAAADQLTVHLAADAATTLDLPTPLTIPLDPAGAATARTHLPTLLRHASTPGATS